MTPKDLKHSLQTLQSEIDKLVSEVTKAAKPLYEKGEEKRNG